MNKFFETTARGNPYRITLSQHVIPSCYINGFADSAGLVEVLNVRNGKQFRTTSQNPVFCVKRVWDQRAESGWMKNIEDNFHRAVSNYLANQTIVPDEIATEFFLLWHIRSHFAKSPPNHAELHGILPENLTKEQEEILETKGYFYVNKEPKLKSRFVASIQGSIMLDSLKQKHGDIMWRIIYSPQRQFLVPKHCPQYRYLPLSPNVALFGNSDSIFITPEYVLRTNKSILDDEDEIVFSKSITDAVG